MGTVAGELLLPARWTLARSWLLFHCPLSKDAVPWNQTIEMKFQIHLSSFLLLLLVIGQTQGVDLFVSPQGLDVNLGTVTQPLRTINRAYGLAVPGTTIIIKPGVYNDYTSGWGLRLGRSGTAAAPIILRSEVKGGAVIDGQNAADRNVAVYLDGSYNVVDGFEIRGGPKGGLKIWGNNNQIINNEIHHNGNVVSASTFGQDGIYSDKVTRDNVYRGNLVRDNGRPGSNLDHGLYLCGDNELVINNVSLRNAAYGIQVAGYTTVANMRIYNNVIAFNGKSGIVLWQTLSGIDIKNNIIYRNSLWGIDSWEAHGSGVTIDRNIVFGNGSASYDFTRGGSDYTYTVGTTISAEPLFVNATSGAFDAHLKSGSPAIDAGAAVGGVTTDFEGNPRPHGAGWDIGAYEYGGTGPAPPPLMPALSFEAEAGQIVAPFTVSAGAISQSTITLDPMLGGAARYRFNITQAGEYVIRAIVAAPNASADSFFINIDGEPTDPVMIWDIGVTIGPEERVVSWRGNGTFDAPEFSPKRFVLAAGEHTLTIRGREGVVSIDRITIESASGQPEVPREFRFKVALP